MMTKCIHNCRFVRRFIYGTFKYLAFLCAETPKNLRPRRDQGFEAPLECGSRGRKCTRRPRLMFLHAYTSCCFSGVHSTYQAFHIVEVIAKRQWKQAFMKRRLESLVLPTKSCIVFCIAVTTRTVADAKACPAIYIAFQITNLRPPISNALSCLP